MNQKKYKVLHLPTTIGGNPQGLSRHLREVGVDSESWAIQQNYFGYPADRVITKSTDSLIWAEIKKLWALTYIFKFQVIFFNFGRTLFMEFPYIPSSNLNWKGWILSPVINKYHTLMHYLELWLLTVMRRKIFIQYQGDDARQGDYCLRNFSITIATEVDHDYYNASSDAFKRKKIGQLTKLSCKTFALNPDLLHVLPTDAEFLPYSHISLSEWSPHYTQLESRPLRIGHAPSHRGAKGTSLVIDAIHKLKQDGYEFEFVLIEGLSNAEAKEHYKTVDVLVDQLFAGWYGGLAVEMMALGKPVIAYLRMSDLHFIPFQMREDLPIIQTEPDTIYKTLEYVLKMPRENLLELSKRSRDYVEKWHDPICIAKRIKIDIENALSN